MTTLAADSPPRSRPGRAILVVLVLISMVGPLSLNIAMPVLPMIQRAFDTSRDGATLVLSVFLAGMAVAQLLLGPLADRLGRRPVLLGGLSLYVVSSAAALLASSIGELVLARVIQSLGATVGLPLARTIIRDLYERDEAASMIGYVTMAMVVAPMISPFIGAYVAETIDWHAIFAVCMLVGLLALGAVVWALPETRPANITHATTREVWDRSIALLGKPRFLGYAGTTACASAMFFAFQGGSSFLVIDVMGLSARAYTIWFMIGALAYMIGNFVSGRFSRRLGIDRMVTIGNWGGLIGASACLVLALVPVMHPAALFLPMAAIAFSNGLLIPNAIAGAVSIDLKAAGAASGLAGFLQSGVSALASLVVGGLVATSAVPIGLAMTILGATGILCALLTHPR